jgi:hypothetical protein
MSAGKGGVRAGRTGSWLPSRISAEALDLSGRAQLILPAFRIWTAQHIVPVFRVRPAEFILISWSVRAAQQIPCVPIWLWFTIAIRHLYLLALDMWREPSAVASCRRLRRATSRGWIAWNAFTPSKWLVSECSDL